MGQMREALSCEEVALLGVLRCGIQLPSISKDRPGELLAEGDSLLGRFPWTRDLADAINELEHRLAPRRGQSAKSERNANEGGVVGDAEQLPRGVRERKSNVSRGNFLRARSHLNDAARRHSEKP